MAIGRRQLLGGAMALGAATALAPKIALAQDGLIVDGLDTSLMNNKFVGLLREGGVHCVHKSVGDALSIGQIYHFVDNNNGDVTIARTVTDIHQAKEDGKIAIVMGSQAAMDLQDKLIKAGRYSVLAQNLESYHGLGLRVQGICYNMNNVFGGGNLNDTSPLTRAGRVLVEEIHKVKMVLDVGGHTGEKTSLEAISMSSGVPVICSYSNVEALMPNIRAISNQMCEAIAKTGGVIGITALSDYHKRSIDNYKQHGIRSPQATLNDHLDQYDYLKKLVGVDHVGLGPDFVCGHEKLYENILKNLDDHSTFPPEMLGEGALKLVKEFKDISYLGNVIKGLKERGWSATELDKLLGGNWLRVYKQVWGA